MRRLAVVIFIIINILACSYEEKNEIQFRTIVLKKDIPLTNDTSCKYQYHVDIRFQEICSGLPDFIQENINFELNKYFFSENIDICNDANKNFDKYVLMVGETYKDEVLPLREKLADMPEMLSYDLIKNGEIIYNKKKIVTISCQTYSYTGGLHGIHSIEYLHFDLNTGQLFTLEDLFHKSEKEKLIGLVAERLKTMRKDKEIELFDDSQIESIDNFYFDDNNFYFVFNPYEIGPYSEGYIKIDIDLKQIKPLLKKNINPWF